MCVLWHVYVTVLHSQYTPLPTMYVAYGHYTYT
jgi:hypothetical protein